MDPETEALTRRGWKRREDITTKDSILTLNPWTDEIEWQPVQAISIHKYKGEMHRWTGKVDALTTPNHRWLASNPHGRAHTSRYEKEIVFSGLRPRNGRLITGGGTPLEFSRHPKWDDELVETVGWYVTEGVDHWNQQNFHTIRISQHQNSPHIGTLRRLAEWWRLGNTTCNEWKPTPKGIIDFYFGKGSNRILEEVAPGKQLTPDFLCSLTIAQARLLYETLMDGDGCRSRGQERWTQIDQGRVDGFQMLAAMLGKRSRYAGEKVTAYFDRYSTVKNIPEEIVDYDGEVWCPTVENSIWLARRNGTTYWTGNTSPEGTRQVFTYVEIITDTEVSEYVNDSLIGSWPNVLGRIPIVHIRNLPISGSPWGMSDINDIMGLNREFNEKATDISDIINYHACVDEKTEALTRSGWKKYDEIGVGEEFLTLNPETDEIEWDPAEAINVYDYSGSLVRWDNRVDALTTPNHRWLAERRIGRPENKRYERQIVRTSFAQDGEVEAASLREGSRIILGGGVPTHFPTQPKYEDEFIETVGWFVTEGTLDLLPSGNWISFIHQSDSANPEFVGEIRRLQSYWYRSGATFTEQQSRKDGVIGWYLGVGLTEALLAVAPNKSITPEFLTSLTYLQAVRLLKILVDGDGTRTEHGRETWYQDDLGRRDGFQMLVAMVNGTRTRSFLNNRDDGVVDIYQTRTIEIFSTIKRAERVFYRGKVWCPTVPTGIWFARRNGVTYWTGNSPVTVLTGARAGDLEKGTKRVWSIPNKDARISNLAIEPEGIQLALEYLKQVKSGMHEMTGVPEGALGQAQAISNTSGVALAIQYMPLMMRNSLKLSQYSQGIEEMNKIILLTLYLKEPLSVYLDPTNDVTPRDDNLPVLNMYDPVSYENTVVFQSPLPVDKLVKLNELQLLMALGLESKVGALTDLGEEFPYEKLEELFKELVEDAERQGALDLLRSEIASLTAELTGFQPSPDGPTPVPPPPAEGGTTSAGGSNVSTGGGGVPQFGALPGVDLTDPEDIKKMFSRIVTMAHGTTLANNQKPQTDKND